MTKVALKACLFSAFWLTNLPAFAIHPVSNVYAGVFLGPTYTPSIDFNFNPSAIPASSIDSFKSSLGSFFNLTVAEIDALLGNTTLPNKNVPGTVKYSILGGIGGEVGYRFCTDYRVEAELLYNNNPFSQLTIGNYTIESSNSDPSFHISGDTNTVSVLFNFLYDVPIESNDGYAAVRPYFGAGMGYAYIFSDLKFHYGQNYAEQAQGAEPATLYETNLRRTRSAFAVQGIIGLSYFIDDFCWLSLDARYFATPIKTNVLLATSGVNYQSQIQLFSVMLGFHGVFSHETR